MYWAFTQSSFHHTDSHFLLTRARTGDAQHPNHLLILYVPVYTARALLHLGIPAVASLRLCMAACASAGIGFFHRAALTFGGDPLLARRATLAAAVTPALFYFATMIELQALTLPWVALATWAYARVAVRPAATAALLAGCSSGLATAVHSTGQMLPVLFAILGFCGWRHWRGFRTGLLVLALAASAHAGTFLAIATLMGQREVGSNSAGVLLAGLGQGDLGRFLRVVLEEWLLAFLPFSVFVPLLAFRAGRRRELLGLLLCTGMLLAVTFILIGLEPRSWECGAYLLPLCLPTGWLAVRDTRPALARALIAAGFLCSMVTIALHARSFPISAEFARDARQMAQSRPLLILSDVRFELDSLVLYAPELKFVDLDSTSPRLISMAEAYRTAQQLFELAFRSASAEGRLLVFPDRTWQALAKNDDGVWDRLVKEYLPEHFTLEHIGTGTFAGLAVTGRR